MGNSFAFAFFSGEPIYQMLLILAMLLTGFYNALWKEPVMVLGGKRLILFRSFFVLIIVLIYDIIVGFSSFQVDISLKSASFLGLILISLLSYPGLYFFVKAVKSGPSSVVVPIFSISIIVPILFESLYLRQWIFNELSYGGILLILSGLVLLKFRFDAGRIVYMGDAGFRYVLLSVLLLGTVFTTSANISYSAGASATLLVQEGSILVMSLLHIMVTSFIGKMKMARGGKVPYRWSSGQLMNHWKQYSWIIGTIGVTSGLSVVFRMISNQAPLPMATTILSLSSLVSVFVANGYYGENLKPQQKLAVAFIIAGIFIVSWIGDGQATPFGYFFMD